MVADLGAAPVGDCELTTKTVAQSLDDHSSEAVSSFGISARPCVLALGFLACNLCAATRALPSVTCVAGRQALQACFACKVFDISPVPWFCHASKLLCISWKLQVKCVPWLPSEPSSRRPLDLVPVRYAMAAPAVTLGERMGVEALRGILRDTKHSGFPVVRSTPAGQVCVFRGRG